MLDNEMNQGSNNLSNYFSENETKFDEVYKKEVVNEINPNLQSLEYLSTTYLSKNHPILEMDIGAENDENELYNQDEEQDAADLDSENDENYLDNFSFDINNSQTISNFSNSLDAYNKNQANKNLVSKTEQLKVIYMRSFLNRVENDFKEKDVSTTNLQ